LRQLDAGRGAARFLREELLGRLLFAAGMSLALAAPTLAEPAMTAQAVTMRSQPTPKSSVVQRMPANAEIDLMKCARGWCRASWRNRFGYVPVQAVVLGPPPAELPGQEIPPSGAPVWRWDGAYIGGSWGFGSGNW
jgi:hypothetical protein